MLLYTAGGFLIAGLLLTDEPASYFRLGSTTIRDHTSALLFATVSIVCSFWPSALEIWRSATHGRAHWKLLLITLVAIGMALGKLRAAATFAFVFALVSFARDRSSQSPQPEPGRRRKRDRD